MIWYCEGYTWSWVNHDVNYVDPVTGDHTNKIESSWFAVKRQLPRGGKYDLQRSDFTKYAFWNMQFLSVDYPSYHPILSSCLMTPSSAIWQPSYGGGFVGTKAKMISMSFSTYSPLLSELKIKTLTTPGWIHLSFNWIFVCFLAPSKNEGTHLARVPLLCKRVCQ